MKIIRLNKGQSAIVDDDVFDYLNQWKWYFNNQGYAVRRPYIKGSGRKNQKCMTIHMHRLVNNTPNGMQTDHINRNKLDNRRENLRNVTDQQNKFNLPTRVDNTSGRKGVYWDKQTNKWRVLIQVGYKSISLGRYLSIQDAVEVREIAERKYHAIS